MRAFVSVPEMKNVTNQVSAVRGMTRAIRNGRVQLAFIVTVLLIAVLGLTVGSVGSSLRADDEANGPKIVDFDVSVLVIDLDAQIYWYMFKGMVENWETLENPKVYLSGGVFDEMLDIDDVGIFEKTVVVNGYGGFSVSVEAVIMELDLERSPVVTVRTP